jgi:hypothetical protein
LSLYSTIITTTWWCSTAAFISYFLVQELLFSTTLGKSILGLRVIQNDDHLTTHVTPLGAILRNLLRPIDAIPGFYLVAALFIRGTTHRQRLGDLVAHTVVVNRDTTSGPAYQPKSFLIRVLALLVLLVGFAAFCLYFDYYQRPPLFIEGEYNTHRLLNGAVRSYTLGTPLWGARLDSSNTRPAITYPIQFVAVEDSKIQQCKGQLSLAWDGFLSGWEADGAEWKCTP